MVWPSVLASQSEQLTAPLERSVRPFVPTTITYAGETFTFNTTVGVYVKFKMISWTEFELTAKTQLTGGGGGGASGAKLLQIYWVDEGEYLYNGEAPADDWTGIVNTEGGWTEK